MAIEVASIVETMRRVTFLPKAKGSDWRNALLSFGFEFLLDDPKVVGMFRVILPIGWSIYPDGEMFSVIVDARFRQRVAVHFLPEHESVWITSRFSIKGDGARYYEKPRVFDSGTGEFVYSPHPDDHFHGGYDPEGRIANIRQQCDVWLRENRPDTSLEAYWEEIDFPQRATSS